MSEFFPYRLDRRWTPMFTAMRVSRDDGVTLTDDGQFSATIGVLHLQTSVENIDHTEVTGPHRWYTAVGARLSFADDGLTFGTNHHLGLCVEFVEKIPRVIGPRAHSALWTSVADPDGLAAALGC